MEEATTVFKDTYENAYKMQEKFEREIEISPKDIAITSEEINETIGRVAAIALECKPKFKWGKDLFPSRFKIFKENGQIKYREYRHKTLWKLNFVNRGSITKFSREIAEYIGTDFEKLLENARKLLQTHPFDKLDMNQNNSERVIAEEEISLTIPNHGTAGINWETYDRIFLEIRRRYGDPVYRISFDGNYYPNCVLAFGIPEVVEIIDKFHRIREDHYSKLKENRELQKKQLYKMIEDAGFGSYLAAAHI